MQNPPIVIECDACKARFLLDGKLVKGYRAAQVRCRKCGGPIRITIPEPPILEGSPPAQTRRDPAEAPPPRFTAPAPPLMEGSGAGRTTRSSAVAQSLPKKESETGATPNNLSNLQRIRISDRGSMTAGSHDISRKITAEMPHVELPSPEAIPETKPRSPADSPTMQPVPLPNTLEKSVSSPSKSRTGGFWRRRITRFRPSITFLVAILWTTFGLLFIVLLIRRLFLLAK